MSGSSNNSWTIVTPEETAAAESLRPLSQGTQSQDEPSAPSHDVDPAPTDAHGKSEEDPPDPETSEEKVVEPSEDSDASAPPSALSELQTCTDPEPQTEGAPVDSGLSSTEPESFSDSYTHLGPPSDETPASVTPPVTTETLGYLDSWQDEEQGGREQTEVQDEAHQPVRPEEEEEETKEESPQWSPIESPPEPTFPSDAPETELRRRRLAALEKIGRRDEEEEAEEDFQLPQRDDDSGITLNKCILGAVILLGLGTIFISGVFMDLDEENDAPAGDLKEPESSVKQEWLNPDISRPGAEAEILNKLTKGNEQIEKLQAQLQSQSEELKVAKEQAAEGSSERLRHEEVQRENTAATTPPGGRTPDTTERAADYQVHKKDKHDRGFTKEWKDGEKSEWKKEKKQRKDGGKTEGKEKEKEREWKKEKYDSGKSEKKQKEERHWKQNDEKREWKKDKSKRGDEGMAWKEKKEKKEWNYEGDKKHKHDRIKERKNKEERDYKESHHYHQEKHKGPEDKYWKKERDERKDEKKHRHEEKHGRERDGRESGNRKDDRERKERGKETKKWKKEDEERSRGEHKEKKYQKERVESKFEKKSETKDHAWSDKKTPKPKVGQSEYWERQKERIQHSSKPLHTCDSPDACAEAEGLRPISLPEFEFILKTYLSKAENAGVDASQIAQLQKLASEMFQNGVFPHHQMSFQDYVEDVGDILEDLVEDGDKDKDSAVEDEMEGFEEEVMQAFMLPRETETKAESERGRG